MQFSLKNKKKNPQGIHRGKELGQKGIFHLQIKLNDFILKLGWSAGMGNQALVQDYRTWLAENSADPKGFGVTWKLSCGSKWINWDCWGENKQPVLERLLESHRI